MNLLTPQRRIAAAQEIQAGLVFCLSMPLNLPGGGVLNNRRKPPAFKHVMRGGHVHFNLRLGEIDPGLTDVSADEAVVLYSQYSSHWDALSHKGSLFDKGSGVEEAVFYNGFSIVDGEGKGLQGDLGAVNLSIDKMAVTGVQGRGVLIDLRHHVGDERVEVGHAQLMEILRKDEVVVEPGDMLVIHTGLAQRIVDADGRPGDDLKTACAVLDGRDPDLLRWITDSEIAAIAADNLAVEKSSTLGHCQGYRGPSLPLHEHCIFKLGIHLGELWYLTELATWLRLHGRSRFFLTAPPLRLPGACGSPVTAVATV